MRCCWATVDTTDLRVLGLKFVKDYLCLLSFISLSLEVYGYKGFFKVKLPLLGTPYLIFIAGLKDGKARVSLEWHALQNAICFGCHSATLAATFMDINGNFSEANGRQNKTRS